MRRSVFAVAPLFAGILFAAVGLSHLSARAFIGGVLACEFDPASTTCIARQIALLQQAAPPGALKDRASAFLAYSWARRGQPLYSRAMEKAPKAQTYRAYAAVLARGVLGDDKTAERAVPYVANRDLRIRALWIYAMAAIRRGKPARAAKLLPALMRQQATQRALFPGVESRCRIAMVQARLGQADAARQSIAAARKVVEGVVRIPDARKPLFIPCAAAVATVEGKAAAVGALAKTVSTLRRNPVMPRPLKLVFLAQAAEQWTRLGEAARSRALARAVIGDMAGLPAARRLLLFEYLFFASFRKPAK